MSGSQPLLRVSGVKMRFGGVVALSLSWSMAGVIGMAFGFGIGALLAAFAMLTRISIKVRLAWSTVAQMGFMLMECGLGLYTLALLHLIGHSLYKAHAFLSASGVVEDTRLRLMRGHVTPSPASMVAAPLLFRETGARTLPSTAT